jgi:hypothetical protein
MLKKSASGVLARHRRLIISPARTTVASLIRNAVRLSAALSAPARLGAQGWADEKKTFLNILRAMLVGL